MRKARKETNNSAQLSALRDSAVPISGKSIYLLMYYFLSIQSLVNSGTIFIHEKQSYETFPVKTPFGVF